MHPILFKIPIEDLMGLWWQILIPSVVVAIIFYLLSVRERKRVYNKHIKGRKEEKLPKTFFEKLKIYFVAYFFSGIFYIGVFGIILIVIGFIFKEFTEQASINLNTYGLMLAIAFIVGIILLVRKAMKDKDVAQEKLLDMSIWLIILAIIGSRFFFMVFESDIFISLKIQANGYHNTLNS